MVCTSQVRQGSGGRAPGEMRLADAQSYPVQVVEPASDWGLSASVQAWTYLLAQTLVDPSFLT